MGIQCLRIVPYTGKGNYRFYLDGLKIAGKRNRLYFKTEPEAIAALSHWKRQLKKEGDEGAAISADLRIQAVKADRMLAPFKKTILEAAHFLADHCRHLVSTPCSIVFEGFQESKARAGHSSVYLTDIKYRVGYFIRDFGARPIESISTREIEEWLYKTVIEKGNGNVSYNNLRAHIELFFAYALKHGLVEKNPVTSIEKRKLVDKPPEIFTPIELAEVLAFAPFEMVPSLAIQAFAGLRSAEMARLDWSEVNQVSGYIRVPAEKSKTAQRRLVPIAPNLADWLRPYTSNSGLIYPKTRRTYECALHRIVRSTSLKKWPHNGLRHSFASYHIAEHEDAGQLALLMGHSTTKQIFASYRELVTAQDAHAYWSIKPAGAANIVTLPHAHAQ